MNKNERKSCISLFRRIGYHGDHPVVKKITITDVICCCVDCGQGEELDGLERKE